jgi:rod shape determining protein RodA
MTPLFKKFLGMSWLLSALVFGLFAFGVLCVYSATEFRSDVGLDDFWRKQIRWVLLGVPLYFGAALVDYRWMRWGSLPAYLGALALLAGLQFAPDSIAPEVNGAKSWFDIAGIRFQPSQPMVAAGIIAIAFALAELHKRIGVFRFHFLRLVAACVLAGVPALLVVKEGDLGSASIWGPVLAAMLLVGNIPVRYLVAIALCVVTALPVAYNFGLEDYQKARVEVFLDSLQGKPIDTQGEGYATDKIFKAIGSAGWEGKGFLGKRVEGQKTMNRMGFLPKLTSHNDFVFAVQAEEFGYRGSMLLLFAFGFLLLYLVHIAACARDQLGRLVVVGVATLVFAHAFQHIGMQAGLLPITGLPLPFISYGGTFTVSLLLMLGFVQSVWVHRNTPAPEQERRPTL